MHFQKFPQLKTVAQLGIDNPEAESIAIHNHYEPGLQLDNPRGSFKIAYLSSFAKSNSQQIEGNLPF